MTVAAEPPLTTAGRQDDIPDVPIYRLSVAQYHEMARGGILEDGAPVELLEGWLVQKMTQNPPHVLASDLLYEALVGRVPTGWHVRAQHPVTTPDSEPEPDLAVIRGSRRDYIAQHPGPQDAALVIEVADTSLRQDRGTKKRLYARAGIPVYWIVNLNACQIEVYTGPVSTADGPEYQEQRNYSAEETIPIVLDGAEVGRLEVKALLP